MMWTRVICATVALSLAMTAGAQSMFRPSEGDFSVAFPRAPVVGGELAATQFDAGHRSYTDEEPGFRFVVVVDQYPAGIPTPKPTPATYLLLLKSHAKEQQLTLVSTHAASLGGRQSLEGLFVNPEGRRQVLRVLMVGPRIYHVECDEAGQGGDDATAEAFLDSFRLG